jgi:hypothetical protein
MMSFIGTFTWIGGVDGPRFMLWGWVGLGWVGGEGGGGGGGGTDSVLSEIPLGSWVHYHPITQVSE